MADPDHNKTVKKKNQQLKDKAEAMTQEIREESGAEEDDLKEKQNECGVCTVMQQKRKDLETMVECEMCERWICYECHRMDKRSIVGLKQGGVHWVCSKCDYTLNDLIFRHKEGTIERERNESTEQGDERTGQAATTNEIETELRERIRELENKLSESKAAEETTNNEKAKGNKVEEKLNEAKKENKRKEQEIKKLKSEINTTKTELTKADNEIINQKETNSNLNHHINEIKKINKRIEEGATHPGGFRNETDPSQAKTGDRRKSIPCKFYQKNLCKFGEKCYFKHENKTEVCRFYEQNQWCRYKDKCRYKHVVKSKEVKKKQEMKNNQMNEIMEKLLFLEDRLNKVIDKRAQKTQTDIEVRPQYRSEEQIFRPPTPGRPPFMMNQPTIPIIPPYMREAFQEPLGTSPRHQEHYFHPQETRNF